MEPDPSGSRSHQALLAALAVVSFVTFVALAAAFWIGTNMTEPNPSPPDWAHAAEVAGSWKVLPPAALAIAFALTLVGRRPAALFVVVAVAGAGVATYLAKGFLQLLQADDDGGRLSDYPSAHVAATAAFAGAMAVVVWQESRSVPLRALVVLAAIAVTVAMGWARVSAGDHSTLDVLGGGALASGWLALLLLAFEHVGARNQAPTAFGATLSR